MFPALGSRRVVAMLALLAAALGVAGCGKKEPPAAEAPAPTPATAASTVPAEATPAVATPPAPTAWTPEALEELLAPIALYPDPVLSQVLIASTNPQEVLDAGNWLIANEGLQGKALDDAAAKVGFTPPVRALIQFPQTVDMMCMEMGWTTELGQAFIADQAGVLDAVQRLRRQAMDVGNLKTSQAMKVETEVQEGKEVVVLKPPKPDVVYVPTYDPQQAYAPVPASTTTTTTTTTVEDKTKYDKSDLVMTGVLAFGAGILVNELFDDDDHHHDYYYPNYGYGGMPYYPPYPYRPVYGGGYYPSNGYNRPPNWNNGFQNNGNIIINTGGRPGQNGGYWDRYDNQRPGYTSTGYRQPRGSSPITAAQKTRPELAELNQRKPRPMPADYQRPSRDATASNWKGQSTYQGRDRKPAGVNRDAATRIAEASPGYSGMAPGNRAGATDKSRPAPKVQGSYAGKDRSNRDVQPGRPGTLDASRPTPTRDVQRPSGGAKPGTGTRDVTRPTGGDRGYGTRDASRPAPTTRDLPQQRPQTRDVQRPMPANVNQGSRPNTAVSGASRGGMDRAASQRGKQSMPQGARSKGGGGRKQGR